MDKMDERLAHRAIEEGVRELRQQFRLMHTYIQAWLEPPPKLPSRGEDPNSMWGRAGVDTFRVGFCLIRTNACIPGPEGDENQTSVLDAIAKERGTQRNTIREHAENGGWLGHDMRTEIENIAATLRPDILHKWLEEWKKDNPVG